MELSTQQLFEIYYFTEKLTHCRLVQNDLN